VSQRERDLRRDAGLATLGVQVVRFTHDRLTLEPQVVRREVLAILRQRGMIVA
jgi:very-short-patch-repair endonuclease